MKKKIMMCIAAALCLGSSMTAYAAPETMPDGTVFDPAYYAEKNPDVAAAVGTDTNALYNHYVICGKAEGRSAVNPNTAPMAADTDNEFDAIYYAQNNPDVVAALGTDANILYQHYINYGKAEGRLGSANRNANKSLNGMPYIERTAEDVALIGGSNDVVRKDYSNSELYQGLWNQAMQNINAYITGAKIWPDDPANSEDYYGYLIYYKFSNKDWKYKEWFEIWNTAANFEIDLKKYILSNFGDITVICRDGTVETLKIDYNRQQVGCVYGPTAETGMIWVNHPLNSDYVIRMLLRR